MLEIEGRQDMVHDRRVAGAARNANDPRLLSLGRAEQRLEQRLAVTTAAALELEAGEPKLVAVLERAKQPEADRRRSGVSSVGPEYIARHGHGLHPTGLRIFLDEIPAPERALESGEEFHGARRIGSEGVIEASLCRTLPDQGPQHRQVSHVCRNEHGENPPRVDVAANLVPAAAGRA